jgi:hypothetical protein
VVTDAIFYGEFMLILVLPVFLLSWFPLSVVLLPKSFGLPFHTNAVMLLLYILSVTSNLHLPVNLFTSMLAT